MTHRQNKLYKFLYKFLIKLQTKKVTYLKISLLKINNDI